jgi:hypothetical protein
MHDLAKKCRQIARSQALHHCVMLTNGCFYRKPCHHSNPSNPNESQIMTEPLTEEHELQPRGLMKLPPELREQILNYIFQDHLNYIETIPFPRPAAGDPFQPRFHQIYNVVLCRRVLVLLHVNRTLRQQSFDVYMPLSTGFWASVNEAIVLSCRTVLPCRATFTMLCWPKERCRFSKH